MTMAEDLIRNSRRIVARWETRGHDFIELSESGGVYSYRGTRCGGVLAALPDDAAAIAAMDRPWGDRNGTGACTVLRSDRPTLRRVL